MMNRITWEREGGGNSAMRDVSSDAYLSPPASRLVASRLMHELSTVSGNFGPHGLVVFLRVFGMSQFDKTGGTFYGLYTSGQDGCSESPPNYCIRKAVWTASFRSLDSVVNGIRANTLFFESTRLDERWTKLIDHINHATGSDLNNYENLSETEESLRANATHFFYASTESLILQGEYKSKKMRNRHLESLFAELNELCAELESTGTILADEASFRVSYDFDRCSFLFR